MDYPHILYAIMMILAFSHFYREFLEKKDFFSDADMQWIQLIECLRNTGMPISEVKNYVELCLKGDETLEERLKIVKNQETIMKDR